MTLEEMTKCIQEDLKCTRYAARKHLGRFRQKYKGSYGRIVEMKASYEADGTVVINYVVLARQYRRTTI